MEDKRITKSKNSLKATLLQLLDDMPFEKIAVTDICSKAKVSRITFYNHYSDKYALVDDIFQHYADLGRQAYAAKQTKNNPKGIPSISYCNILDSTLDMYYTNMDFFKHTTPESNPYLAFKFYDVILSIVEEHTMRESFADNLRYSPKEIAGFICFGLTGFINEGHKQHLPIATIRKNASQLMRSILKSDILVN